MGKIPWGIPPIFKKEIFEGNGLIPWNGKWVSRENLTRELEGNSLGLKGKVPKPIPFKNRRGKISRKKMCVEKPNPPN